MCVGGPNPQTCINWKRACKCYADNKDIPVNKIIKCTLGGIEDVHFINWIKFEHEHIDGMTLEESMTLFHATHLPE